MGSPARVKVVLSMESDVLDRIDAGARRAKMNRSDFIASVMEVTLESQEPVIDFGDALGRVRARLVWPKWKPAVRA